MKSTINMTNQQQANEQHWQLFVLLLKEIAKEKGITQDQMAEQTGMTQSNISRVFRLDYCPNLRTFMAIVQSLGVNFFFEDKDGTSDLNQAFERAMQALGRRPDKLPKN